MRRRWVMLGGIRSGSGLSGAYHYVASSQAKETACGIAIPIVCGFFWGQRKRKCGLCVSARAKRPR